LTTQNTRALLAAHYPLIVVLLASFLAAASMAVYTNWDAQLEYEAAQNVITQGFPYLSSGLMINQPPLGFYLSAPAFAFFGLTYQTGIAVSTAFGLGCVALVYALGVVMYGRRTALVASAVFGIIPWHIYMSRIFLIDNQYLFFSLFCFVVGVVAVKRDSQRLILASGVLFAVAFLVKLFAVFVLVPLFAFAFFARRDGFRLTWRKILLFLLPTVVLQAVWFGGFAHQHFFGVYLASDLTHPELVADPSPAFLPINMSMAAGWALFLAVFLSVALSLAYRQKLKVFLHLDAICLLTATFIMGLDMLLVFGFHLQVPYVSAVKYNYLTLPFFCLLAASVVDKAAPLIRGFNRKNLASYVAPALVATGLVLLFASLLESTLYLNSWVNYAWFGVSESVYYPFNLYSGLMDNAITTPLHWATLALMVTSLLLPFVPRAIRGLQKILATAN
jgi:4-amino-4-deoxy-L-arabinose transferase-like glycosyltransferase